MKATIPLVCGLGAALCAAGALWWLSAPAPVAIVAAPKPPPPATAPAVRPVLTPVPAASAQPKFEIGADLEDAFLRLNQMRGRPEHANFLERFYEHVTKLGIEPALAWVRRLEDAGDRQRALSIVGAHGFGLALKTFGGREPALGIGMLWLENGATLDQIVLFANDFATGKDRAMLLATGAATWLSHDPAKALRLADQLQGEDLSAFMFSFGTALGSRDPTAALNWTQGIPDEELRSSIQASIILQEANADIASAVQHLELLPAESEIRADTSRELAFGWARSDREGAERWRDSLPLDSIDRAAASRGIQETIPPTGIGVQLAAGDEGSGYPVIRGIVPGSSAEQSDQLRPGDQIAAIQNPQGGWTPVQNLPLQEVTELIRGPTGSTITLRILPPEGGPPRTVRLTRQQITLPP